MFGDAAPKNTFNLLLYPSTLLFVRGPDVSKWFHIDWGYTPSKYVLVKYSKNESIFEKTSTSRPKRCKLGTNSFDDDDDDDDDDACDGDIDDSDDDNIDIY